MPSPRHGPLEQLRDLLERERRMRESFTAAWPRSTAAMMRAVSSRERDAWRAVLDETRPDWERAYVGEPAEPREQAAAVLAGALDG